MSQRLSRLVAIAIFALCAATFAPSSTSASVTDVIFSNLGPGDSFGAGAAWALGQTAAGNYDIAAPFTTGPSVSVLGSADLAVGKSLFSSLALSVEIWSDAANAPGAPLVTADPFTSLPNEHASTLAHATFSGAFALQPNTTYWFVANSASTFDGAWAFNNTNDTDYAYRIDDGPWTADSIGPVGAFRINAIPSPTASASTFVVMAAFAALRRRREYHGRKT